MGLSVVYLRSVSRGFPGEWPETGPFSRRSALWAGFGMLVNYDCKTAGLLPDDVQALGQRRPRLVQLHVDAGQLDAAQVVAMDVCPRIRCRNTTGAQGSGHPGSPLRHRREPGRSATIGRGQRGHGRRGRRGRAPGRYPRDRQGAHRPLRRAGRLHPGDLSATRPALEQGCDLAPGPSLAEQELGPAFPAVHRRRR